MNVRRAAEQIVDNAALSRDQKIDAIVELVKSNSTVSIFPPLFGKQQLLRDELRDFRKSTGECLQRLVDAQTAQATVIKQNFELVREMIGDGKREQADG